MTNDQIIKQARNPSSILPLGREEVGRHAVESNRDEGPAIDVNYHPENPTPSDAELMITLILTPPLQCLQG